MTLTDIAEDDEIAALEATTIYVCITCRRPSDPEDAPRPGLLLARATKRAAEGTGLKSNASAALPIAIVR